MENKSYPKYQMFINGDEEWLTLGQAGSAYNNGWIRVEFGSLVRIDNKIVRNMTDGDKVEISDCADRISDSK